jgi:hypothetical protein
MTWGHKVFKATPHTDWQNRCTMHAIGSREGKCNQPTGYVTRYHYVTGQAGRTSSSDRWVCKVHAERFAGKYKCAILETEPAGRSIDSVRFGPEPAQ